VLAMLVWSGVGFALLAVLMYVDSLFTPYKDAEEIRKGNAAVITRFVMKLLAQGLILSQSIAKSDELMGAVIASLISFAILLIVQLVLTLIIRFVLKIAIDDHIKEGKVAYAVLAGTIHVVGALIITSTL
jgi:uncharacterized membrane protein YjfL (UPF0719 family)